MPVTSNPFIKLQYTFNAAKGNYIQWTLNPAFTGKAPYSFTLQAFEDVGFKEPIFQKNVGEAFFAVDDSNIRQNLTNSYMYRVVLNTADQKRFISPWIDYGNSTGSAKHKWLMANEITRKHQVGMWRYGLYGYLLKRKNYAPVALGEVDPVTGEPTIDSTAGSFGVGQKGGYFDPVLFKYWLMAYKGSMDYQQEGRGITYREDASVWTVGFPFITSHDIMVNEEGKRFMVTNATDTFFPGTLISLRQSCTLQIIPSTDTVYSIPVPDFPHE